MRVVEAGEHRLPAEVDDAVGIEAVQVVIETDDVAAQCPDAVRGSAAWAQIQQVTEGEGWSLEMASVGADAPVMQARSAAGHGPCVVVEPPRFGLVTRPLHHRGQGMQCALYASWERTHYAGDDIRRVVRQRTEFTASHVPSLYPAGT